MIKQAGTAGYVSISGWKIVAILLILICSFALAWAACGGKSSTTSSSSSAGIASRYPGDIGIANDPDVVFADDFESYSSASQLTRKWNSVYHLPYLRIATEPQNVRGGRKSLEMTIPTMTTELSNEVVKKIIPNEPVLFVRMYQKWAAGYFIQGSNHNGISISGKYPGPGTAPPANGSGFFLFMVENITSGFPVGDVTPGDNQIYAYWPNQRTRVRGDPVGVQWGDQWFQDGEALVYMGNELGEDRRVVGNRGDWQAFPSRYPDWRPIPNFVPQRNRWYCYEFMVKVNTLGRHDGEVKVWVDGQLSMDFPDLFIRNVNDLLIDNSKLMLHAQRNPNGPMKKWYDQVVMARKYIGPMK